MFSIFLSKYFQNANSFPYLGHPAKSFDAIDEYFEALTTSLFSVAKAVTRRQNELPNPKYSSSIFIQNITEYFGRLNNRSCDEDVG